MTTPEVAAELAAEQQHVDQAYARLDELRGAARARAQGAAASDAGAHHQAMLDRETMIASAQRRLHDLEIGTAPLVFGRMDLETGEVQHVGRIGVSDARHDQLVMDWRAPAAEPFYRATGRDRLGIVRRRHLICRGPKVLSIDDEVLDGDAARGQGLNLVGEGALLSALDQARTGRMGDIVATIQSEQDQIIRAPLASATVVQGGPGTGKTAVALHRVAYLLYTHRFPLEDQGVLVLGPSPLFLRYVEQVLPSLGEHAVKMATLADLVPLTALSGHDTPEVAALKSAEPVVDLLKAALRDRQRPLRRAIEIPHGPTFLKLTPGATRRIVDRVAELPGPHNERRLVVERQLLNHLWRLWERKIERDVRLGRRQAPPKMSAADEQAMRRSFDDSIRRRSAYREVMERIWPVLSPHALLHDLFGSKPLLRSAAEASGAMTTDEAELLHRPRSESLRDVAWTVEDIPLIDELLPLLGTLTPGRTSGSRSGREDTAWLAERIIGDMATYIENLDPGLEAAIIDRVMAQADEQHHARPEIEVPPWERTFGHIVVDEAQELTPMAWRMINRRCPRGSLTLVGDLGQAASELAPRRWEDLTPIVSPRRPVEVRELTVNYRTPAEVMDLAARVLAEAAPGLEPPTAVRSNGQQPTVRQVVPGTLLEEVATLVDEFVDELDGSIAVIAAEPHLGLLADKLGLRSDPVDLIGHRVVLLHPETAKGLEFDGVIIAEPADVAGDTASGLRTLYVAMTRPTQRLALVHEQQLPACLSDAAI